MDFVQNKGGLVQNSVNGSDLVILKGNFGNIKNKQAMKTNKKDLRDVETQVFPSDHEQVDPKVNVTNSNQQKKLEEEIHTLEIQLDDLKKLEKSTAVTEIDKEKKALKDDIEPDSDWSYEIIK
jgi:hypothetical protein